MAKFPSKSISQQVTTPQKHGANQSIDLDNTLQLDSKINILFGLSNNLVNNIGHLGKLSSGTENKYLLLSNTNYLIEDISSDSSGVIQGSNSPVISPSNISIKLSSTGTLIFDNIEFFSDKNGNSPILVIQNNSKVMFRNCIFKKPINSQTDALACYISIENGSKATFSSCWFMNRQTHGFGINNAGLAINCTILGGYNTTTLFHNGVSIIGELT